MVKSLNKVQLIGNLTRDPELRYTPQGTAVATFSVATNRRWKTDSGDTRDEADFHRLVAWDKLAEICSNYLKKGSKVYVEGRLQTRNWETQDGQKRSTTEVVISDMIMLDSRGAGPSDDFNVPDDFADQEQQQPKEDGENTNSTKAKGAAKKGKDAKKTKEDDIPF